MTVHTFHDGRVVLHGGDCLDVLADLPPGSVDAVITDPPYHFDTIVKRFGGADDHGPLFGGGHEGVNRSIYGEFADERGKRSGRTIGRAGSKGRPA